MPTKNNRAKRATKGKSTQGRKPASTARGGKNNKGRSGGKRSGMSAHMTLKDLLTVKLQALYDVETQLVKAIPKMAAKAVDPELKQGFEKHARQTQGHATRLERAFDIIGVPAKKLQSEAIRGLIADAEWVMKNVKGAEALDANLIAAARYVEHYEMAGYDSAIQWAKALGWGEVASLLEETLQEEEDTDAELTEMADSRVDERAMGEETGSMDGSDSETKEEGEETSDDSGE